ncbi:MAG: hypothetical protein M1814_006237 [Vezdaea aestivalis]|nr:MAG: hypothetical protein M1814_006237 [Vezdaea aestivalis]
MDPSPPGADSVSPSLGRNPVTQAEEDNVRFLRSHPRSPDNAAASTIPSTTNDRPIALTEHERRRANGIRALQLLPGASQLYPPFPEMFGNPRQVVQQHESWRSARSSERSAPPPQQARRLWYMDDPLPDGSSHTWRQGVRLGPEVIAAEMEAIATSILPSIGRAPQQSSRPTTQSGSSDAAVTTTRRPTQAASLHRWQQQRLQAMRDRLPSSIQQQQASEPPNYSQGPEREPSSQSNTRPYSSRVPRPYPSSSSARISSAMPYFQPNPDPGEVVSELSLEHDAYREEYVDFAAPAEGSEAEAYCMTELEVRTLKKITDAFEALAELADPRTPVMSPTSISTPLPHTSASTQTSTDSSDSGRTLLYSYDLPVPPETSLLRRGVQFEGSQQAGAALNLPHNPADEWSVSVSLHDVHWDSMTLRGTMSAYNVPDIPQEAPLSPPPGSHAPHPRVDTYVSGQIIDFHRHTLTTPTTEPFNGTAALDVIYWRKLPPFSSVEPDDLSMALLDSKWMHTELQQKYVLMRWKETAFAKPRAGEEDQARRPGLTISGFYYISMRRSDGAIEGLYCDPEGTPYQSLKLAPRGLGCAGTWEAM